MGEITLEVCVDDVGGLFRAVDGGADRIELCSALDVGGLTPSYGLMEIAAELTVPTYVMIRPRSGNFKYSDAELEQMKRDIAVAGSLGLAGVVLGVSMEDNRLNSEAIAPLLEEAGSLGKTLHRAIDLVPDYKEGVQDAIGLGFERILTSGSKTTALEGIDQIADMHRIAAGDILIMPGCGINATNAMEIVDKSGVDEVHSSCARTLDSEDLFALELGFCNPTYRWTDIDKVQALKKAISQ